MQLYNPNNSVLNYFNELKQQNIVNQLAQSQEERLLRDAQLREQQFSMAKTLHDLQMQDRAKVDSLAKMLGEMLPSQVTTPGLSPQQLTGLQPEIDAFGQDAINAISGAMQYGNQVQPHPLAQMLPNLPHETLGALLQQMMVPDNPVVIPEGAILATQSGVPLISNLSSTKAPTFKDMPISATQAQRLVLNPATREWEKFGVPFNMHGAGATVNVGQPVAVVNPKTGKQELVQFPNRPGGAPIFTGLEPAATGKPSEFEAKAALYFQSMRQASQTLNALETQHGAGIIPSMVDAVVPEGISNVVRRQPRQSYNQAMRQWIDSINRVRSGAQLPEYEYQRAVSTFFPVFGDSVDTLRQKAIARASEEEAMLKAAGAASKRADDTPPSPVNTKVFRFKGVNYTVLKELPGGRKVLRHPTTGKTVLYTP